ncbi:AlbA family DNA-binding domain-containing protein [Nocardia pseudovaccinii]|uniref:AlbA family DNA-binding domain-containing protein n=1 Tax=Nocardia pseudovaccinii TaxID=189540 RepID=UPI003D8D66A7
MRNKVMLKRGTVTVLDDGLYWEFDGVRREVDDYSDAIAHIADLAQVPARDLQAALRRYISIDDAYATPSLHVVIEGSQDDDIEFLPRSAVSFTLADNQLVMDLDIFLDQGPEDGESCPVTARIAPLLARTRMSLIHETQDYDNDGRWWEITLRLSLAIRGKTAAALADNGMKVAALIEASAGHLDHEKVVDLLRGGFAEVLVGQPESDWLEAKREHYDLKDEAGQIKLARAVSQFANARHGGLVVIGLATRQKAGTDLINALTPTPHDPNIRRKYIQVLQNRIYPLPDRLRVEVISSRAGDYTLIKIPPQPDELKPFLVHGAVIGGRVNNTFISIVERRDDEGISASIASIHSTLVTGRALLRTGRLPQ